MAASANHTRCVSCGEFHNHWPVLDGDGGDLCDACFHDQADDAWFDIGDRDQHVLEASKERG